MVNRSGTEEEYGQQSQLLEDIYTFRKDILWRCKRKKDDKRKAEEMRDAAMVGLGSKLKVNSLYLTDYFMSHRKFIIKQESFKKLSNFKTQ